MLKKSNGAHAAEDVINRSHSRRDLARFAVGFGVGAVVLGRPAPAYATLLDPARIGTALPRTPEAFFSAMEERFNSLDVDAALELFHEDAVFVDRTGGVHHGKVAIGTQLRTYFDTGLRMILQPRHIFVTGDTALSINDWSYDGTGKNGAAVKMNGSTSDVLRRCDDGVWRYMIDNPFGTSVGA